ncbi:hypothetical protein VTO58DRAFT_104977 [Aureobasidium pullulans]|nr:hypothetical protein JADG_000227 [Aureobasidium pullulans]TIA22972.1 hypothetical protein D6C80_00913 [Aureobasidium pullulans]
MSKSTRNRVCGPHVLAWADNEETSTPTEPSRPVSIKKAMGIKYHTPTKPYYDEAVFDKILGKHFDSTLLTKDLDPHDDAFFKAQFNIIRLRFNQAIRNAVSGMSYHDKCNMIDIQRIYLPGKPDSRPYIRVVLRKREDWMSVDRILGSLRDDSFGTNSVPIRYHLTFGAQQQREQPPARFPD